MIRYCVVLCFLFLPVIVHAQNLQPQEVQKYINAHGAKAAKEKYFAMPNYGEEILNAIQTGTKQWIEIALQLHLYTDAGDSEGLDDALGAAMLHHPENILPLVDSKYFSASMICKKPIYEPNAQQIKAYALYIDQLQAKLETVKDPALQIAKNKCLFEADKIKRDIPNWKPEE